MPSPSPAAASPAPSPSPSPSPIPFARGLDDLPPEDSAAVVSRITAAMERLGIPGLSAAIVTDRRAALVGRLRDGGPREPRAREDRPPSTGWPRSPSRSPPPRCCSSWRRARSTSTRPSSATCPSFPAKPWPVTARHLLAHQSGIRNWTHGGVPQHAALRDRRRVAGRLQGRPAALRAGDQHALHEPRLQPAGRGDRGRVGHAVRLDYLARARLRSPRGWTARAWRRRARHHPQSRRTATSDRGLRRAAELRAESDISNRIAGGGLVATAEDVARFAVAIQRGDAAEAVHDRAGLLGRQRTSDRKVTGYGLGWIVGDDERARGGRTTPAASPG